MTAFGVVILAFKFSLLPSVLAANPAPAGMLFGAAFSEAGCSAGFEWCVVECGDTWALFCLNI
jgi:hypothetical protein